MLRLRDTTRVVWAFVCILAVALASTSAAAKSKAKRHIAPLDSAAGAAEIEKPSSTPARFFTIKQVLAKIDAGRGAGKDGEHKPDATRLAALGDPAMRSDAPALRGTLPLQGEEPFGLLAFRAPEGILWRKWRGVEADLAAESRVLARCRDEDDCPPAARRFRKIVEAVKAREGRARIGEANRDINASIRYVSDFVQHGEPDRWTAPLATLAAGRGDCEDYAIAKYVVLRAAGFPVVDLQLVLVRDRLARQDHAVLSVRLDGRWLILDNRHTRLVETAELPHFMPLFAIDHQGVKLFAAPYAQRPAREGESVAEPIPAAWLDGEDFSLRGALLADETAGSSGFSVAPLLM